MSRLAGGLHDLTDEALSTSGRWAFVADAPRLDAKIILAPAHLPITSKSGVAR
ncbi:MAG: hypothetical protein AAGA26_00065 [Pseudomonadota bacterium]